MTFDEVLGQIQALLEREKRVSYRGLKRRFDLDDEYLEDLKEELIGAKRVATDEDGRFLVWTGNSSLASRVQSPESEEQKRAFAIQTLDARPRTLDAAAERRQLTVLFCDLVGSTALSEQLDPEEYRTVVRAYQETCAAVIRRYDGHLAQHLGDGLLVYFGYPVAHEDDAQRAVRTGLEIITALSQTVPSPLADGASFSPSPFQGEGSTSSASAGEGNVATQLLDTPHPNPLPRGAREFPESLPQGARGLKVRLGIHTGLVVIGEIGSSEKREVLALGETPNIAARLQSLAEPDTVVVSAATYRLVQGLFESQDLGPQTLKGISSPLSVHRMIGESPAQSRFEAAISRGLTPLVGREEELGLLRRRWEQAKTDAGQVVLLSGEPGIGKSRLVQALKEHVVRDGATWLELRCSPYHQHSAYYPILDHLQRFLQFTGQDTRQTKLEKLARVLSRYRFPQADTLPLLAAFLSLPHPESAPPLTMSPQKQKGKTQEAIVAWLVEEAENAPVYCVWEDLHWADPSTLELLTMLLAQVPATRLLALMTFRPEFTPSWGSRSYLSQLTLSRLDRPQVQAMVEHVSQENPLPVEVIQRIVAKTDGVPLFVEELTKTVLESAESIGSIGSVGSGGRLERSAMTLGIPATLQDALMARLDRLGPTKEVAQIGATLGREFSYDLLHAVSPLAEESLQQGLRQLVETELLYQRGLAPYATYLFKHALIQDTAYQSLLKSKRQQLHRQIAQVLEERFPATQETQPELLARHYTEASLVAQAIPYWQRAGERAAQRSAYVEAIAHLTKGLDLLQTLPDTLDRAQQELTLQISLGGPLMALKGYAAPELEKSYTRALDLCRQLGETPQLFPVLIGLWRFYIARPDYKTAHELGEHCLNLAQRIHNPARLLGAYQLLGITFFYVGEFGSARTHLEQALALYDPQKHKSHAVRVGQDPGVACLSHVAWVMWSLGYPDQALKKSQEALAIAQELSHPFSLAQALISTLRVHQQRREGQAVQRRAEALIALSTEQGFAFTLAWGTIMRGWALTEQEQEEGGIAQMRQGLTAHRSTGAENAWPYYLGCLAETYGKMGQAEEGLNLVNEALARVEKAEEREYEAELYRLKGELLLAKARGRL
jgi:class 3 adenylate cyclase/predicted ATPase